jgi:hypothetical protein
VVGGRRSVATGRVAPLIVYDSLSNEKTAVEGSD